MSEVNKSPSETIASGSIPGALSGTSGTVDTISPSETAKPVPAATIEFSSPVVAAHEPRPLVAALEAATIDLPPPVTGFSETMPPQPRREIDTATIDSLPRAKSAPAGAPQVEGYIIQKELGRGGMGVVYKARQIRLNRIVALKMVLAGAHAGAEQLARFFTEAEAVAQLQHPNIVQIYEVSEHDGLPYFSLEYVDGGSLAERIGGKPQPVEESAGQVELLARAMAFAHERGIIHRDLKPANVLLTADALPKITDFGLAKRLESDAGQTKSGTLMGTPNYMAPEQARGDVREVGPLADVYALGVILYEMLTGRTPFLGASILDTLQQVRNQEPVPPSRLQPKVPRDLETICLKCLEKEPAKRYVTAEALADDLRLFLNGEPIQARPVGAPERLWRWCQRNRRVAALSAAVLLLLVSLAVGGPVAAILVSQQKALAEIARGDAERNAEQARKNEQQAVAARLEADQNAKSAAEQRGLAVDSLGALVTSVKNLKATPATQKLKQDLLQTGIDGLKRVAKSAQGSHTTDAMMAEAYERMGDVFQSVGEHAEARQQYEQAHPIRLALAKTDPDQDAAQRNLAKSFSNLGDITYLLGDRPLSQQHYREALRLRQALVVMQPANTTAQKDLATSYTTMGKVSEPDEARSYYTQALTIRQALVSAASGANRASLERDVWIVFNRLAELSMRLKDYAAAREHYDQALVLASKLSDVDRTSPRGKIDLALAHVNSGNVRLLAGDIATAKECFGKSLALFRPLAKEDPRNLELQTNFVLVLARHGDHVEAAQQVEMLRSLSPQNRANLYNVACCYSLCVAAVLRDKTGEQLTSEEQTWQRKYGDQAIAALRQAATRGLKEASSVTGDSDLDAIRDHPEYPKLLEELK